MDDWIDINEQQPPDNIELLLKNTMGEFVGYKNNDQWLISYDGQDLVLLTPPEFWKLTDGNA